MMAIIAIIMATKIYRAKTIQTGDKTHHHDQSITRHSFNTTNAMVSRLVSLTPFDDFLSLML